MGYLIMDLARLISRHLDDAHGEITMAQGLVLYHLAESNGDCVIQQDLAEILNINKSGLLRTIDILEKKGFIRRMPVENDRRKNRIELTEAGKFHRDEFLAELVIKEEQLAEGFTEVERAAIFKILAKFKKKLGAIE